MSRLEPCCNTCMICRSCLPIKMPNNAAIQKYSSALDLHPEPDSYMAGLEHVCEFLESNLHVGVQVKVLNDNAFLLYIDQDYPFMPLYKMLPISMEDWINKEEVKLIQYTPEYGSVGCVATEVVQLQISGLPCNLNSAPVIEYILGPLGSVSHMTQLQVTQKETWTRPLLHTNALCGAPQADELGRAFYRRGLQMPHP